MPSKQDGRERFEALLHEVSEALERLGAKAGQAGAEGRVFYERRIEELRAKQGVLRERLDRLGHAGGDVWEIAREGAESAWKDLKEAVDRIRHDGPPGGGA